VDETTTKLLEALQALGAELRTAVADGMAKISQRCDALDEKLKKSDAAGSRSGGNEDDMAQQTAADRAKSDAVSSSALASLARSVAELKKNQTRSMGGDLNAFADAQARADTVMRAHGASAEPPMAAEDLVAYEIRLARKMQPHSPKWKRTELSIIAADSIAFQNVLADPRRRNVGGLAPDRPQAVRAPRDHPDVAHRPPGYDFPWERHDFRAALPAVSPIRLHRHPRSSSSTLRSYELGLGGGLTAGALLFSDRRSRREGIR
jgi:hypothetical protein